MMGNLGGRGEGVVGVMSGGDVIAIFPGALLALQVSSASRLCALRVRTPERCSACSPLSRGTSSCCVRRRCTMALTVACALRLRRLQTHRERWRLGRRP